MADKLKTLLQAYHDDILARQPTTLSTIASFYIVQSPAVPPDFSADLPCVLIWPGSVPVSPLCLPATSDYKEYTVNLSLIVEGYQDETLGIMGDSYVSGLFDLVELLETYYRREKFSLTQACELTNIDYSNWGNGPFIGTHTATLSFRHQHSDMRSENMYDYIMNPSGTISLSGTDSLSVGYKTIRVQSTGGAVTMTALPHLEQPTLDGRMCILQGMSDTDFVTFQDESNLTGSGLFLMHARDVTLGKNDTLTLLYDDTQGKWLELGRTDSY